MWSRQVKFNKSPVGNNCATKLLEFHTNPWSNTRLSSSSRERKDTIFATIAQFCTIFSYHPALLSDPSSAAVYLRCSLECVVSFSMADKKGCPIDMDRSNMRLLTWSNGIKVDASGMAKVAFSSTEENMCTQGEDILKANMEAIKSIINAVQSCPVVWDLEESVASTKKPQSVCPEISLLLEDLIQVCPHEHICNDAEHFRLPQALVYSAYEHRDRSVTYKTLHSGDKTILAVHNFKFVFLHRNNVNISWEM